MKIATWNVNSVRTRLDHVTNWLKESDVDVLCMQETKVVDDDFPRSPFEELGYQTYIFGQKSYNGVALASKAPLDDVTAGFTPVVGESIAQDFDAQKRVIAATLDGIRIVNLYVPNGSSIGSEKYDYKLNWFKVLKQYLETSLEAQPNLVVCGDFNVALEDRDIYKSEGREKHIMSSPDEREALNTMLSVGLADVFRKFTQDGGQFSWWDYRAAAFRRNMGWRIDHHYASPPVYERAIACTIDVEPRKLEKPSDHTPVILEIS
ncbi:MAG: exodeoxyribonuclease III [Cyanobacteria bacterium P01_A01_bin.37]